MERYETIVKLEKMRRLVEKNLYESAMEILETIDVNRIKTLTDLSIIADVYGQNDRYEEAMEVLQRIYQKTKTRRVLYQLVDLSIKRKNIEEAEEYLKRYIKAAPQDFYRFIFRYCIDKLNGESYDVLIASLEQLKEYEYIEMWAYELAKLYHKAGMRDKCVRECSDIILWFGDGIYVEKAKLLKGYYVGEINPIHMLKAKEKKEAERKLGLDKTKDYTTMRNQIDEFLKKEEETEYKPQATDEGNETEDQNSNTGEDDNSNQEKESDWNQENTRGKEDSWNKEEPNTDGAKNGTEPVAGYYDDGMAENGYMGDADGSEDNGEEWDNLEKYDNDGYENEAYPNQEYDTVEYGEEDHPREGNYEEGICTKESNTVQYDKAEFHGTTEGGDYPKGEYAYGVINEEVSELSKEEVPEKELAEEEVSYENCQESYEETAVGYTEVLAETEGRQPNAVQEDSEVSEDEYEYAEQEQEEAEPWKETAPVTSIFDQPFKEAGIGFAQSFGCFVHMESCKAQIEASLENTFSEHNKLNHLIIAGDKKTGKSALAKKMTKVLYHLGCLRANRVAKISAGKLNHINLITQKNKIADSCLIIEEAGLLTKSTASSLRNLINELEGRLYVILEDSYNKIEELLTQNMDLTETFPNIIYLPEYTVKDLYGFAAGYIEEKEYRMTDEVKQVLYNEIKTITEAVKKEDRLEMVMELAHKAKRAADERNKKGLADLLKAGNLESAGLLYLLEEDIGFVAK